MIKQLWHGLFANPRVVALRRRYFAQTASLVTRLSPPGYLVLHLTIGALLLIASAWILRSIVEDVLHCDLLRMIDVRVSEWLQNHTTAPLTAIMLIVTRLGSTLFATIVTLLISLFLMARRRWYTLLTLQLAVSGGMLLNVLMKTIFQRQRPSLHESLVSFTGYSFPSGHTMAATVLLGAIAVLAVRKLKSFNLQVFTVLIAGLAILFVGFSRIYLGAHYLSDVLAAMAEGLAWLAITVTSVNSVVRKSQRNSDH